MISWEDFWADGNYGAKVMKQNADAMGALVKEKNRDKLKEEEAARSSIAAYLWKNEIHSMDNYCCDEDCCKY